MYRVLVFLCLVGAGLCQLQLEGSCTYAVQEYVDYTKIFGTWLQYKRIDDVADVGQCTNVVMFPSENTGVIDIITASVNEKQLVTRNGTGTFNASTQIWEVVFADNGTYNYIVQATDYDNYLVLYACSNGANNTKSVNAQILVKSTNPNSNITAAINAAIQAHEDLNNATWLDVSHAAADCQLQLEGSCTYAVQEDVDYTKLNGTWLQYKRINDVADVGQCTNVTMTPKENVTGVMDFITASVNERKLVFRNGTGTFNASTQIWEVVFADNSTYNYIVQYTDYDNYLVLYACSIGANNTKSVNAQILVKSANPNSNVTAAINATIQAHEDLNSAIWFDVSHAAADCETDGAVNIQLSYSFILLVGLVLMKDL